VRALSGLIVALVFCALFLGAAGDALRGHVSLLVGAAGGLVVAFKAVTGAHS
jgi:hypothetical protein